MAFEVAAIKVIRALRGDGAGSGRPLTLDLARYNVNSVTAFLRRSFHPYV